MREFEFFIRGATCLLQNNDTSSLQSEQMFSLVHYVNHSLEAATYVSQSRVPRDKRFKGDNPGLGCFSRRLIGKDEVFFSVLETEVNCRLDSEGGTWNFDLGDGTALTSLAEIVVWVSHGLCYPLLDSFIISEIFFLLFISICGDTKLPLNFYLGPVLCLPGRGLLMMLIF